MIHTTLHDGSIEFFDVVNSLTIRKRYIGYSLKEAKKLFKAYKKELQKNWLEYLAR